MQNTHMTCLACALLTYICTGLCDLNNQRLVTKPKQAWQKYFQTQVPDT